MKIGLDFDGVMSDCGALKSACAKSLFGIDIPPHKFKKEILVGEGILTLEQYRQIQRIVIGTREVGLLMEPVDGMLHYLPRIMEDGHSVRVITSRIEEELDIAEEWTHLQGLDIGFTGIGQCGRSKAKAARGLDLYADDDLDKLEPLVGIVPHLFLFSWGYNEHIDVGGIATRVSSWQHLYTIIRTLQGIR